MADLSVIRKYLDYFLPREVMGPVVLVFSLENIVDILFNQYAPVNSELIGWSGVFVLSLFLIAWWGEADEDMDEFEEELEEGDEPWQD